MNVSMNELAPSTVKSYKMYINYHFIPYFNTKKLKAIDEMHIKEYITEKLKTLSSTTVRKHFFLLSWILHDALKIKNPCRDISPPKQIKYKPVILDELGFKSIHAALKNTWDEIPLLLAAYCGMREGEIFALKWDDILDKEGLIRVDENRAISEDGYIDKNPKSDRGIRNIAAPPIIFKLIESYRMSLKAISNYLFTIRPDSYSERFGKLIDRHNKALKLIKSGKKCREDYDLSESNRKVQFNLQKQPLLDIRFHDLRHYHATILHKHGISDQYAAERLGHDVMVLKKIYQHLDIGTRTATDERVKNIFS
jgi:integrase